MSSELPNVSGSAPIVPASALPLSVRVLRHAIEEGDIEIVRNILTSFPLLATEKQEGLYLLSFAIHCQKVEVVKIICDLSIRNKFFLEELSLDRYRFARDLVATDQKDPGSEFFTKLDLYSSSVSMSQCLIHPLLDIIFEPVPGEIEEIPPAVLGNMRTKFREQLPASYRQYVASRQKEPENILNLRRLLKPLILTEPPSQAIIQAARRSVPSELSNLTNSGLTHHDLIGLGVVLAYGKSALLSKNPMHAIKEQNILPRIIRHWVSDKRELSLLLQAYQANERVEEFYAALTEAFHAAWSPEALSVLEVLTPAQRKQYHQQELIVGLTERHSFSEKFVHDHGEKLTEFQQALMQHDLLALQLICQKADIDSEVYVGAMALTLFYNFPAGAKYIGDILLKSPHVEYLQAQRNQALKIFRYRKYSEISYPRAVQQIFIAWVHQFFSECRIHFAAPRSDDVFSIFSHHSYPDEAFVLAALDMAANLSYFDLQSSDVFSMTLKKYEEHYCERVWKEGMYFYSVSELGQQRIKALLQIASCQASVITIILEQNIFDGRLRYPWIFEFSSKEEQAFLKKTVEEEKRPCKFILAGDDVFLNLEVRQINETLRVLASAELAGTSFPPEMVQALQVVSEHTATFFYRKDAHDRIHPAEEVPDAAP